MKVSTVKMNDIQTVYNVADLKIKSYIDFTATDDVEKEGAGLLEEYLGPDLAMQDNSRLVEACSVCHGADYEGMTDEFPNIGGQKQLYLLSALRAYQIGNRKS